MGGSSIARFYAQDHDRLDDLFAQFQALKHIDRLKAAEKFKAFQQGLLRHIIWEEELLFPIFEEKTGLRGRGPTEVMRMEHKEIKQALSAIEEGVNKSLTTDLQERQILTLLGAHNQKEEHILYPAIDEQLSDSERNNVFSKMEHVSAAS